MALPPNRLFNLAKSLAQFASSNEYISKGKLWKLKSSDHLVNLLLSKAPDEADKIKVVYFAWFLLNRPKMKGSDIMNIINNLYVVTVDFYDETGTIKVDCDDCYYGSVDCSTCEGEGTQDCRYCDGEGNIECDDCGGEGTEECRYCDGKGTETEEDDEGDEIEVECIHCDGEGKERCRSCGGSGNFECPECNGSGSETCGQCDGSRAEECDVCYGYGEIDSEEEYYSVTRKTYVVVGSKIKNIDGKIMSEEDFGELVYNNKMFSHELEIGTRHYTDDTEKEDRLAYANMDDDFVEIVQVRKLEDNR
jgi:hypothetical protein